MREKTNKTESKGRVWGLEKIFALRGLAGMEEGQNLANPDVELGLGSLQKLTNSKVGVWFCEVGGTMKPGGYDGFGKEAETN